MGGILGEDKRWIKSWHAMSASRKRDIMQKKCTGGGICLIDDQIGLVPAGGHFSDPNFLVAASKIARKQCAYLEATLYPPPDYRFVCASSNLGML